MRPGAAWQRDYEVLPSSSGRGEPGRLSGRKPSAPICPWPWHRGSFAIACSKPRRARCRREALRDLSGSRGRHRWSCRSKDRDAPVKLPRHLARSVFPCRGRGGGDHDRDRQTLVETCKRLTYNGDGPYQATGTPKSLDHKFITEDVPTGLIPMSALGRAAVVSTRKSGWADKADEATISN